GEATDLFNANLQPAEHALIGAGSDNISDVDLFIVEQERIGVTYGETICEDIDPDNTPICTFTARSGKRYLFRNKNHISEEDTPGFVFAVLLEL
ncbi:MAG: hypothetical protein ACRENG_08305, partial [bacterium]